MVELLIHGMTEMVSKFSLQSDELTSTHQLEVADFKHTYKDAVTQELGLLKQRTEELNLDQFSVDMAKLKQGQRSLKTKHTVETQKLIQELKKEVEELIGETALVSSLTKKYEELENKLCQAESEMCTFQKQVRAHRFAVEVIGKGNPHTSNTSHAQYNTRYNQDIERP